MACPPELAAALPADPAVLSARLRGQPLEQLLDWAVATIPSESLVLASSFGAEDVVLIDALASRGAACRVVTLDTGRLPPETYDLIERVRQRYRIVVEMFVPDAPALQTLLSRQGPNGFYDSIERRRACCQVRKLEPLARALAGAAAWMTGLRRAQSVTRADLDLVELDHAFPCLLKLNPLAEWSDDDVWSRIRARNLPYNPMHDRGFPSIGCQPCTRAVLPHEDLRAGRWWWEAPSSRECGLHPAAAQRHNAPPPAADSEP